MAALNLAADSLTENLALPWKQQRVNILAGVTARGMGSLLDGFDRGRLREFALACEQMIERDETLVVAVPKMKRRVAARRWDVLIGEEVPDELRTTAEKHQAALKHAYSHMRCENAVEKNETGGLKLLIRRMMEAPLNRFAVSRLIWRPSPEGLTFTARYCPLSLFDNTTGELRWAGVQGDTPGTAITDKENWLIAVSDTCLMKALSVCYIFKRLPMQDALNFCQRFGIPAVHGETAAKPGSAEWDRFVSALRSFANDLTVATTLGDKFNVLETAAANGEQVFGWIIEMMKRAMVTICCGSDLATMSRENGTGASLQSADADEMTADYCEFISETFNEQIDRRIIEDQFGVGTQPLAYFKLIPPQNEDAELEMKIDEHVAKHGVKLAIADVAERFNRTHDKTTPPAPKSPRLPVSPLDTTAANESTQQLASLELKQRAAFIVATRQDVQPVADALKQLNEAQGANETAAALLTLSLHVDAVEAAVINGDAASHALEVSLATEFLRALASPDHSLT
jgi:phage gp29-like protein